VGLKLKETHQLLYYADDVDQLENNTEIIYIKTQKFQLILIRKFVSKEGTDCTGMLLSRYENHDIKIL
jgi:hypothetical protein